MEDTMNDSSRGQISASAAEIYERCFVPAMFEEWAPRLADAAAVEAGQHVLDVACGTGVLARTLALRTGSDKRVIGLDVNDGMLAVAQRTAPGVDWRHGRAESLPFEDGRFDAVVSQFGLMFFEDRAAAIREMARVLRPGGRLAVAVWDALERTPAYAAVVALLERLFGRDAAAALHMPFVLGDPAHLRALFAEAGLREVEIVTVPGTTRFPSLEEWMYTDVRGWTAADLIDDAGFARLLAEAKSHLGRFVQADGTVAFTMPAHIVKYTAHRQR
jgi:SAM-dependent methyltransferase